MHDLFRIRIKSLIDILDRTADLNFMVFQKYGGHLSKRAREHEFEALIDTEAGRNFAGFQRRFGFQGGCDEEPRFSFAERQQIAPLGAELHQIASQWPNS